MKSLALDLKPRNIGVLILHPGWVKTDMGGENALINVEESVTGMCEQIKDFSIEKSGSFIRFDGGLVPW